MLIACVYSNILILTRKVLLLSEKILLLSETIEGIENIYFYVFYMCTKSRMYRILYANYNKHRS